MNPNKSNVKNTIRRKCEYTSQVPKKIATSSQLINMQTIHKSKMLNSRCSSAPRKYIIQHNCLPNESTPTSVKSKCPNLKRKSISLVELPIIKKTFLQKAWHSKEQGDEEKTLISVSTEYIIPTLNSVKQLELARKACKRFILHAWRRRRNDVMMLQAYSHKLENKVQNLNIQIVVLRNLLESEKLRVAVAMSDSAHLKQRLENELKICDQLRKDKEQLGTEKCVQENLHSKMEVEIDLLKKELSSVACENNELREKCTSYEICHNEFKEKEATLMKKLDAQEIHLADSNSSLTTMTEISTVLQIQVEQLTSENKILCEEKKSKILEKEESARRHKKMTESIIGTMKILLCLFCVNSVELLIY